MPDDLDLAPAERLRLEAQARAGVGDRARARGRMEAALALMPGRFEWREELVDWLLAWGDVEEAHNQALVGLQLSPERPETRRLLDLTSEAVARGASAGPRSETGPGLGHVP